MASVIPPTGLLRARVFSGVLWLLAQNFAGRLAILGGQLVLATILTPGEFGQIGLTYTVMAVGLAITDFGIDQVMIQRQRTVHLWVTAAFWLSLALGVAGAIVMLAVAPIAAYFYEAPALVGMTTVLATGLPLLTLATVPMVLLRAQFRFRAVAAFTLGDSVATQVLTIACALCGFGAYSFVLPIPVVAAFRVALLWHITRPPVRMRLHPSRWLWLARDSGSIFLSRLIIAAVNQGDYVTLGVLASQSTVGHYFFAYKLAVQPVQVLAGNLTNVLLPALSQHRGNDRAQAMAALGMARLLGIVIMPLALCEVALTAPVVHLVFGHKWDDAIPLIQILCVALACDAMAWIAGTLLVASRRLRQNLLYVGVLSPFFFVSVYLGGRHGSAVGVAMGVGAYYALITPFFTWLTFRSFGVGTLAIVRLYLVPAVTAAAAFGLAAMTVNWGGELPAGAAIAALGTTLYCAAYAVIDPTVFGPLYHRVRARIAPLLSRPG